MQRSFTVYVDGVLLTPEIIRAGRKEIELTQAKFARNVGVTMETASRWENGRLKPSVPNSRKIIGVLKLSPLPDGAGAQAAGQYALEERRILLMLIGEKVEEYMAEREKACKP